MADEPNMSRKIRLSMALVGIWSPFDVCSWSEALDNDPKHWRDHAIKTRVLTDAS
jgi:hypothetical protein